MTTPEEQAGQRVADALTGVLRCPNCGSLVVNHPDDGCMLYQSVSLVRDRGNKTDEELHQIHAKCNVDAFWDDIGKVLNSLEDGSYSDDT
jgi:hypothetical protein